MTIIVPRNPRPVKPGQKIKVNGTAYYFTAESAERTNLWMDALENTDNRDGLWHKRTNLLAEVTKLLLQPPEVRDDNYGEYLSYGTVMRALGVKVTRQ